MKKFFFPRACCILVSVFFFMLLSSAVQAAENDEFIFTYSHDGLDCGKSGSGSEKENNFKIAGLPKFSDYPAEEKSTALLDYAQIEPNPDQWHRLHVRSDTKYSSNFNGHYFVVFGNAAQCTGCAYSEIIDTNTGKRVGKLNIYQGFFRQNSNQIVALSLKIFRSRGKIYVPSIHCLLLSFIKSKTVS